MTTSLDTPGPRLRPEHDVDRSTAGRWAAMPFLLSGYLLVFAAVTMVNVALPAAQDDLDLSDGSRQWLLTGYSLAFGGLMLLGGRLGDILGLRRAVTVGLLAFAGASLLGGAATSGAVLLAARVLQGAAGALVAPAALALLSVMFPDGEARGRAFGLLGTVMGVGTAASFVVAGWLTDAASWRWCLYVNIPIAVVAAIGLARTAPAGVRDERPAIDVLSAVTATVGLAALVLAFDRAAKDGWTAPATITLLAIGAGLLVTFVVVARRVRAPLLPLSLVANRTRGGALGAVFVLAVGMFAGMYFLTVYLQDVLGYSALRTGLAFLPFGVAAMAASRALAAWNGRFSASAILGVGLMSIASGLALLTLLRSSSEYLTGVLPTMMLLGIGGTTVMVSASNAATMHAGSAAGVASAAVGATQQVGAALGTALLGSIAVGATTDRYGGSRPATSDDAWLDAVVHGFTRAAAVGALVVIAGAIAVVSLGRTPASEAVAA